MSATTKIEWCDSTWNPWIGCTRVSPACDDCYAARSTPARTMGIVWGPGEARHRTSGDNWKEPARWNDAHAAFFAQHGRRRRVFCASLADVFDNQVDPQWRVDLFRLIAATPNLDWLLLTKRIGNARSMYQVATGAIGCMHHDWPANVWLGATVVNQEEADRDIPKLLATPAVKRFLSMEPLLGKVDISDYMWPVCGWWKGPHNSYREAKAAGAECGLKRQGLVSAHARFVDWVIAGGESGPKARPMHPDWVRSLRDQCEPAGVPFLFKQWGEYSPAADHHPVGAGCTHTPEAIHISRGREFRPLEAFGLLAQRSEGWAGMCRIGKAAAGRLLDGVEHNGFPKAAAA
jgi:protein gp37